MTSRPYQNGDGISYGGITLNTSTRGGEPFLDTTQADLYEVDLDSGSAHKIAENPRTETTRSWLMDPSGKIAAYMDFKPGRGEWRIVNAARDEVAKGVHPLGDVDMEGFGRRADTVLLSKSNTETGDTEWFEIPLRGGEAKQVFTGISLDEVAHDRRTAELASYVAANEQHFLNGYFNTVTRSLNTTFPGLRVRVQGWNDAFAA